jgi:hypothetical protein
MDGKFIESMQKQSAFFLPNKDLDLVETKALFSME